MLLVLMASQITIAQTNPVERTIPYSQDFGNNWFRSTGLPAGFAVWRITGGPSSSQLAAANSTPNADETTFDSATVVKGSGGAYGYSGIGSGGVNVNNGQLYIQTSSSSLSGTSQLALAINSVGYQNIRVSFQVEMINPQGKSTGIVFQYRVGTTGTWTVVDSSYLHSSSTRSQNQVDFFTNLPLGFDANNQTTLQLRWAFSRSLLPSGTGSCGLAIDNIVVTGDPVSAPLYFRSVASGLWNNLALWESSPDKLSWSPATRLPAVGDLLVSIRGPHTVRTAGISNLVVSQLVVDSGATLENSFGTAFAVADGPSTVDLDVQGTFSDSSNISVVWVNSARWRLGDYGTYVKLSNTNSTNWQLYYENGASSIPATSNWICRKPFGSSQEPSISTTNGGPPNPQVYYGNLIVENYTATWNSNALCRFQGSSSFPIIKGRFDIGGSGTGPVSFLTTNTHANPILVMGDLVIRSRSTLRNEGTGYEIRGNLLCDGFHTFGASNSRLQFSGSQPQSVSGNGTIQVYRLQVSKPGGDVAVNRTIDIYNNLTLSGGILRTTLSSLIQMQDNATVTGGSNTSHVNGPMRKIGDEGFTFPVGKIGLLRPIAMNTGTGMVTDVFTAEYFPADPVPAFGSAIDATLDHISRCEYWMLSRNNGTSARTVSLSWNVNSCGVNALSDLRVARWTGFLWENLGNTGTTGSTTSGTVTSLVTPQFGAFTLASLTSNNPLPVSMLSFTASPTRTSVEVAWSTAGEINCNRFVVQRSPDGNHFSDLVTVPGAGTTSEFRRYSFTDNQPLNDLSYYRLSQVDHDGTVTHYGPIVVKFIKSGFTITSLSQLPGSSLLAIRLDTDQSDILDIQVFDNAGRKVAAADSYIQRGANDLWVDLPLMATGIYFVRLRSGESEVVRTFLAN